MPSPANIVVYDALATPVAHTFVPIGNENGVFWFEDQSAATPIGYNRISITLKRPKPGRVGEASDSGRVNRFVLTTYMPTLEALGTSDSGITPPPTIAYAMRAKTEFIMPERSSLQNRQDLRKMHIAALSDTVVNAVITQLLGYY
ncbi:coat protein [ssRNA phage SRR7976356_6]|uniref:Coat protein n=1 Tax=ssRNA phage SRR7976356_6 TaxID=2786737 RepID=A0A8S5L176_9VIRU|nr:coat protein [ssRNA phage SRR7976356_6]DAD51235.1 TPA_asm: coat protein [ssRNA phage SRR7976356_6]